MKLTGISDEAGASIDAQIKAHKELGWETIESRFLQVDGFENGSFHEIPEEAFISGMSKLTDAGLSVIAVGSTIGNWQHSVLDDFQITLDEVNRCIDRMNRVGAQYVRIMSYKNETSADGTDAPEQHAEERFSRLREVTDLFLKNNITPVHENCMNYGGMSISHALETIENVPGLKWVYDTGNPVFNEDRSNPGNRQNSWDFYEAVKHSIQHIHIKDGIYNPEINDCDYTLPGEGHGEVERILTDLHKNNYTGYISIEPHVSAVFHDTSESMKDPIKQAEEQFSSYIEYGKNLEKLIIKIQAS